MTLKDYVRQTLLYPCPKCDAPLMYIAGRLFHQCSEMDFNKRVDSDKALLWYCAMWRHLSAGREMDDEDSKEEWT